VQVAMLDNYLLMASELGSCHGGISLKVARLATPVTSWSPCPALSKLMPLALCA